MTHEYTASLKIGGTGGKSHKVELTGDVTFYYGDTINGIKVGSKMYGNHETIDYETVHFGNSGKVKLHKIGCYLYPGAGGHMTVGFLHFTTEDGVNHTFGTTSDVGLAVLDFDLAILKSVTAKFTRIYSGDWIDALEITIYCS